MFDYYITRHSCSGWRLKESRIHNSDTKTTIRTAYISMLWQYGNKCNVQM